MSEHLLIIKADTNDADYVHRIVNIEKELGKYYNESLLKKVASAIQNSPIRYNWANSEYCKNEDNPRKIYKDILTEDEIQEFEDNYCPFGEYGIHTIKSIELYEISSKQSLL